MATVQQPDHNNVLRLMAKRNLDIGRAKNRTACRLHSLLAELAPGGIPHRINGPKAQRLLDPGAAGHTDGSDAPRDRP